MTDMTRPPMADLFAALNSAADTMAMSSQDWSAAADFAWLYGILVGWDDEEAEVLPGLARKFRWSDDDVALLRRLRAAVRAFDADRVALLDEYDSLFQMQWRRMAEATARWRAEDPEDRALVMPDLGVLLRWLMDDADRARAEAAR